MNTMKTLLVAVAVALVGLLGTRLFAQAGQAQGEAHAPAAADAAHAPGKAPAHAPAHGPGDAHAAAPDAHGAAGHDDAGPVPPQKPRWPVVLLILIAAMFLAAAVIG